MKKGIMLFMIFLMLLAIPSVAFASGVEDLYNQYNQGRIADQLAGGQNGGDPTEILNKIEQQVSNIVATVRVIATIFAVVFVIWIGITFFTSGGQPQRLVTAKVQILMFFMSLVCIFMAEPIVRFILSWFS